MPAGESGKQSKRKEKEDYQRCVGKIANSRMSKSLNVIALISGGKDSLYSILHCIEQGHKIVALANLYPKTRDLQNGDELSENLQDEDIDSFMYQTIGHRIIPFYAEALELPLYRRQIAGTASQTQKDYQAVENPAVGPGDETEDLVPLLNEAIDHHPEANAVSTGAILSTYQRTRVESVAIRLGLTPISYLWQYPFLPSQPGSESSMTALLDDMEAVGCEARIIKIASGGLEENMLWADVCNIRTKTRLINGMQRFVGDDTDALKAAVLGEGGEFETLALDGPGPLWKKRISIDEEKNSILRGEGGTSSVRINSASIVEKSGADGEMQLRVPPLMDVEFKIIQEMLFTELSLQPFLDTISQTSTISDLSRMCEQNSRHQNVLLLSPAFSESITAVFISNLHFPLFFTSSELRQHISDTCSKHATSRRMFENQDIFSLTVFATLLVRSMTSFDRVNDLWSSLFSSRPNPPSRVTISCGDLLPEGVDFSIAMVVDKGPHLARDGLHVQSWSYWAPANIGPYSQSITVPLSQPYRGLLAVEEESETESSSVRQGSLVYIAGQIPLDPSKMTLHSGEFHEQALLALQHLWRIGIVQKVDYWLYGIAYLSRDDRGSTIESKARVAFEAWKQIHILNAMAQRHSDQAQSGNEADDDDDDDGEPDAWDRKYGLHRSHFGHHPSSQSTYKPHRIPNLSILSSSMSLSTLSQSIPPFIAVEVESLPRASPIEWQSLGIKDSRITIFTDLHHHHHHYHHYHHHRPSTSATTSTTTTVSIYPPESNDSTTSSHSHSRPHLQFMVLTVPASLITDSKAISDIHIPDAIIPERTSDQMLHLRHTTVYINNNSVRSASVTATSMLSSTAAAAASAAIPLTSILPTYVQGIAQIIPCRTIWAAKENHTQASESKFSKDTPQADAGGDGGIGGGDAVPGTNIDHDHDDHDHDHDHDDANDHDHEQRTGMIPTLSMEEIGFVVIARYEQ